MYRPFHQFLSFLHHKPYQISDTEKIYMEEEDFNLSTHVSPYLEKYGVFLSCGL